MLLLLIMTNEIIYIKHSREQSPSLQSLVSVDDPSHWTVWNPLLHERVLVCIPVTQDPEQLLHGSQLFKRTSTAEKSIGLLMIHLKFKFQSDSSEAYFLNCARSLIFYAFLLQFKFLNVYSEI